MREEWRKTPDLDGYFVSSLGRVRKCGRILYLGVNIRGYSRVCVGERKKYYLVHQLVLRAFVGKPLDKQECNHKNGIKADARIENLEWVSHAENSKHAFELGFLRPPMTPKGSACHLAKLTED